METIKDIIKVNDKVIATKSECIGIKISSSKKELIVSKVNKKSFITGGIKFNLWKVTNEDAYGHIRKDGKQCAIFNTPGNIDGIVEIEF